MTNAIMIFSRGALLSFAATASIACDSGRPDVVSTPAEGEGTASVEDIKDEPARFIGKTVTISGEVEGVEEPRAFRLAGAGWLWDDEVTVVTGQPVRLAGATLEEGDDVIVTGTVRRSVIADVEREVGWDLQPELEASIENRPFIVASSVRKVEEAARWTADAPEGAVVGLATITMAVEPDRLTGQRVELESIPVRAVRDKALWVGWSGSNQVLVAPTQGATSSFEEGDRVTVNGTLKKMPPVNQAVKTFGLPPALRAQIADEKLYVEGMVTPVDQPQARQ